jgi:hypothetical protein
MHGAFGQIPSNDDTIGKMASGELRASACGLRYVVSFCALAARRGPAADRLRLRPLGLRHPVPHPRRRGGGDPLRRGALAAPAPDAGGGGAVRGVF